MFSGMKKQHVCERKNCVSDLPKLLIYGKIGKVKYWEPLFRFRDKPGMLK